MLVVAVEGRPLPAVVADSLTSTRVEQNTGLPDVFTLRFTDPEGAMLEAGSFALGRKVRISAQTGAPTGPVLLLEAEVTAMEFEVSAGAGYTMVRGLDLSHRLRRGTKCRTFVNMSASDVVRKVAGEAGLACGRIDSTTPVYPYLAQEAESDWDLLARLAVAHERLLTFRDGKLDFAKHAAAAAAGETPVLTVHRNVVELRTSVTASDQVSNVEVRGWDPAEKMAVNGRATASTASATLDKGSTQEATRAFGSSTVVVADPRITDGTTAANVARSRSDHRAGGYAEIDGVALGDPDLRAGKPVSLEQAPAGFAGKYVLTSVRHEFDARGAYLTHFAASHGSDRSLFGSVHGATRTDPAPFAGVAPAIVTNVKDDEEGGRVKVKFPWWDESLESSWCRTVHAGAAKGRGLVVLPEVGDEVLVAFVGGDFTQPVVLGGMFNRKDRPDPAWSEHTKSGAGAVTWRGWTSRTGMKVAFVEQNGNETLEVSTNRGAQRVTLLQTAKGIQIVSEGPVEVTAKKNVKVEAQQNVDVKSLTGSIKVGGTSVEVSAQAELKLKGATVSVDATGPLTLKGAIVKIN